MAALVEILFHKGAIITGSDVSERFYTDEVLERLGLHAQPFGAQNITDEVQYVIYSSAYKLDKNPDLIEAVRRGVPCLLYTQALGAYSERAYSCGVCGVHGKTSTTGLVGTILKEIDLPSQVLAGSVINSFGGTCTYTSKQALNHRSIFVAETCEYQRHFMSFCPQKIILTSVESDHQDYYPTYEDIRNAFVDYICKLPVGGQLIYCADDQGAVEAARIARDKRPDIQCIPYGENAEGDYRLQFGIVECGKHFFTVQAFGQCAISVPGNHNVRNAVAALALAAELLKTDGKNPADYAKKLKDGLAAFAGGKRRSEIVGKAKNAVGKDIIFIDDYGHHPTAIKTTLAGYRDFYKKHRIIVDFMSHTYTRTAALLEEFASSFADADDVILNKIYGSAREDASCATVTGETLAEHARKYHRSVHYCAEFGQAAEEGMKLLAGDSGKDFPDGFLFVTMGAGDNWKVGKHILEKMRGSAS